EITYINMLFLTRSPLKAQIIKMDSPKILNPTPQQLIQFLTERRERWISMRDINKEVALVKQKIRNEYDREILGVQLCFRRFPIDGFSGKWWSK
ncbi:hypothetical protein ALC53_04408, partial [Atta colombica]